MPRSMGWGMVVGLLLGGTTVVPVLLWPGPVRAQVNAISGAEHYFQVQWQPRMGKRGPVISGSVHNSYGAQADDVQLQVEGLDAAGAVVSRTFARVLGTVPPLGDAYFEIRVPPGAASYRVTVVSFNYFGRGAGP